MGNKTSTIKKINFEDMQTAYSNEHYLIINTLEIHEQDCLIKNTIQPQEEINILNKLLTTQKKINLIIYGVNACDESVYLKYEQLINLGFINVYVYPGGLFEWLLLQDIYGPEEFPTTTKELDILKYKGRKFFGLRLLEGGRFIA